MSEITPNTGFETPEEQRVALELWAHIDAQEASSLVPLPEATRASTLVRYEGDDLGAAMAIDVTRALLPELSVDGTLDDEEADIVDRIVEILKNNHLAGATIEDIAHALDIDFELGALYGLREIVAILSEERWDSHTALEDLRREIGLTELLEDEETEEAQEAQSKAAMEVIDSVDLPDDTEDDSEEAETGTTAKSATETVVDESGRAFTI